MPVPTPDQRAGCLLGLALGDALGFVVEAEPPEVAAAYVRDELRAGRAGARSHPAFPFGQYSDDTQLARELLLSVRDSRRFDPAAFARRVAALFAQGRDVGAGPGSRGAALRLAAGVPWTEAGAPAPYAGNGSAMRAASIGLLARGDIGTLIHVAVEQSRVTHQDSRCAGGAVAMAGAAALAAGSVGGPIDPAAFVTELAGWVRPVDEAIGRAVALGGRWAGLDPHRAAGELRAAGLDPEAEDPWPGVSSCVVPSVAWAVYAFLRSPDSYWDTVCTAVEIGGDTDTLGAMAGALAGARLGAGALPAPLLGRLTDRGEWDGAALADLAKRSLRL
ncbi:MAG: ADP-ribosylglycohydrolase family protein [Gemmatimonadales bacterium]